MPIEPWWETNPATTPRQELGMVSPELHVPGTPSRANCGKSPCGTIWRAIYWLMSRRRALRATEKDSPLFRASNGRSRKLTAGALGTERICEVVKQRLKDAGLPSRLSPHSFRVTAITALLEQGVPMEDVQYLAGHAAPRTTGLYDWRQKKMTRNIVERMSL